MARHSKSSDEPAVNLDSLMDALTNVVAVLILVLILLQADVGKAVERLLGDLKPATPEQVQQAKDKLAQLAKDRDAAKAMLAAKPPDPKQIDQAKVQLALLEKSIKDSDVRLLDVEKLRQLQAKHQSELDAEKKKTDALLEEIRKLEALLDDTPLPQEVKPDIVRIPNSREIPEGANIYYAYVIGERVHLVDPVTAEKLAMDEFEKVRAKMLKQTVKVKGGKDRKIYDQDKLVKHFATLDLKVRGQKITVPYNRPWTRLAARRPPRGNGERELGMAPHLQSRPQFPAGRVDVPRPHERLRHLPEGPRDRRSVPRSLWVGNHRRHLAFGDDRRHRGEPSRRTQTARPEAAGTAAAEAHAGLRAFTRFQTASSHPDSEWA